MNSKVISKIRVCNPNKKNTPKRNMNHLKYIATRDGTDLTQLQNQTTNEYVLSEDGMDSSALKDESSNKDYIKYIANRPRSHGLFGNIDTYILPSVTAKIEKMSNEKKVIYRGILSLREDDATKLGYLDKEKWSLLLNASMGDIAEVFNIPIDMMEWVAAFHLEQGHPHVHYMFWDSGNRIRSPYIHPSKQDRCREIFSARITEDERSSEILRKNEARDKIIEFGKIFSESGMNFLSNLVVDDEIPRKIPDKVSYDMLRQYAEKLVTLAHMLPKTGRIAYAYMPVDIKSFVDEFSLILLDKSDIKIQYSQYLDASEKISLSYTPTVAQHEVSIDKARKDILKRFGNIMLSTANDIRKNISEHEVDNHLNIDYEENNINEKPQHFDAARNNEPSPDKETDYMLDFIRQVFGDDAVSDFVDDFNEPSPDDQPSDISSSSIKTDVISVEKNVPTQPVYQNHDGFSNNKNSKSNIFWTDDYKEARRILYNEPENHMEALKLLENEVARDNYLAAFDLAYMNNNGLGTEINTELADKLYKLSFSGISGICQEKQDTYLQYRLGKMYIQGIGTDQDYDKGAYWLDKASLENYSHAQYTLGCLYRDGKGVGQDHSLAFNLFSASASGSGNSKSNIFALHETAKMYEAGIGVKSNQQKADIYYKKAFEAFKSNADESSNDLIHYKLGKFYYEGKGTEKDITKAEYYFKKAAKSKNYNAIIMLSKIYFASGEKNDFNKAFRLLSDAAEHNNPTAKLALSRFLLDSKAETYNPELGLRYLNELSESGNSQAKFYLGKFFTDNSSICHDIKIGLSYLQESSDLGNEYAKLRMGKILIDKNSPEYNPEKGIEILTELYKDGNTYASYYLGKLYYDIGTKYHDYEKSISCFTNSATGGNQYAQYYLGKLYYDTSCPYYDLNQAVSYFKLSADQDNSNAIFQLAKILLNKVNKDHFNPTQGIELLNRAVGLNNQYAQYYLGKLYMFGEHVSKDIDLSLKLLNLSSEQGNKYAQSLIEFHNKQFSHQIIHFSYKFFLNIFNSINNENYKMQNNLNELSKFKTRSKAVVKEEQKHKENSL